MSKNLIKVLAVSIITFGFTTAIFADGEKPIASPTSTNNNNYVYLALQGGIDSQHFSGVFDNFNITSTNGFAARASLGYGFNKIFAVEAGYAHFFNEPSFTYYNNSYTAGEYQTQVIDAFLKLNGPITDDFNLYLKVGADYMFNRGSDLIKGNIESIGPAFGVGASYNFTPNWVGDVSWTRYANMSNNSQPNIDFVGLGITYKFNL